MNRAAFDTMARYFMIENEQRKHQLNAIADAISGALLQGQDVNEYDYFSAYGIENPAYELTQDEMDYIDDRINYSIER